MADVALLGLELPATHRAGDPTGRARNPALEAGALAGIKKKAFHEQRTIVFVDESGLSERPHRVRTWAPRGQTPVLPNQGSWGGYFEWGKGPDKETFAYVNQQGSASSVSAKYEKYFYSAIFNNFAARMNWARDGKGNRNPVIAINDSQGLAILTNTQPQGATVTLDASKSTDPDGDKLTFKWWSLSEAGNDTGNVDISNNNSSRATVVIPSDAAGKRFHVICEVTDDGTPNLTSYRRIIFEPTAR